MNIKQIVYRNKNTEKKNTENINNIQKKNFYYANCIFWWYKRCKRSIIKVVFYISYFNILSQ